MEKKIKFGKRLLTMLVALTLVSSIFVLAPVTVADNGTYDYVIITTNAIESNSEASGKF